MLIRQRVARWLGKSYSLTTAHRQFHLARIRRLDKCVPAVTTVGSTVSRRNFKLTSDRKREESRGSKLQVQPLPRLWYVHKPFDWLKYKKDFWLLRKLWDPNFNEADFTRGARQAVSTLSQLISKNMYDAMRPLLTRSAMVNLRRDIEILWTDAVRRNIALRPVDIQLVIPIKVYLRKIEGLGLGPEKKLCDIDLAFIGMKHMQTHKMINPVIAFVDVNARFHRNYSEGAPPEWTMASFKLRKFNLLRTRTES